MTRALVILASLLSLAAAPPQASLPDIEDEVMCVTCGTALNISQAPAAERERAFIRRRIAEGLDKDEIKDALVAEYGPKVLAEPRQTTAWLLPAILGVLAVLAIALTLRRWRRAPAGDEPVAPPLDSEDERRLERDMAAYER